MSSIELDGKAVELDPNIFPAADADPKLLDLWNMNGHLYSTKYANPEITSISALIEHNAISNPDGLAYLLPDIDSSSFSRVHFAELNQLVSKVAAKYAATFSDEIRSGNDEGKQPTIALLSVGITFDYLIAILALLRLHIRVLLLSNKNSLIVHKYLLDECATVGCIADRTNINVLRKENGFRKPPVLLILTDSIASGDGGSDRTNRTCEGFRSDDEWTLPSIIIHSSGTTGMPKPIIHTNGSICLIARHYRLYRNFYVENFQLCAPLFHIGGLSVAIGGLPIGMTTTFPPPNWPPPTSAILAGWNTLSDMGHSVDCAQIAPALVEDMHSYIESTTNDFTPLKNLKALQSGGAPFAPALLTKLVAHGVNMKTIYGQTEIAGPMRTLPHDRENPHMARLRNLYAGTGWVEMEDLGTGDGSAECVVYKGYPLAAQLWESPDASNPYRTNDVFREDPPVSGFWVLLGRKDDVVVHSNGEKTMSGGVATLLADSGEVIAKAAVFGTNRPCTAAVIEVKWSAVSDPNLRQVEERVWDAVQAANVRIPKHSRIDRSLLLILPPGEALPVTPKQTVRRKLAWETYGDRVEILFDNFLGGVRETTASNDGGFSSLDALPDVEFVNTCIHTVCEVSQESSNEEMTFYDLGLDSQRAIRLRAMLVRRFGSFPLSFIFENPTSDSLVAYLTSIKSQSNAEGADQSRELQKLEWIQETIKRLCEEIDSWTAHNQIESRVKGAESDEIIYITGANGALGNAFLEALSEKPTVKKVYCAVRGVDGKAQLAKALESRGYSAELTKNTKFVIVPYNMADDKLGLESETYERLSHEVTIVLHNAWRLDFNQPVDMFEPDCLRGTMNLLRFCTVGNRKTFAFTSSISTVTGPAVAGTKVQECPVSEDPRSANSTGYAQSKYIVERVTEHYASTLDMPVRMLRVGQLCGHSRLGSWNESDMWPILIATGLDYLYAMPRLDRMVNWLAVDECASSVASALLNYTDGTFVVKNFVHPNPISWDTLLDLLESVYGTSFARVSMTHWVKELEKTVEHNRTDVPGLKLLAVFQSMANATEIKQPEVVTKSVVGSKSLDSMDISRWLQGWANTGFLRS